MPTIRRLERLFRSLFHRAAVEAELDDEMRLHVELEAEELVRRGASPEEARRHAAIAFGGMQQRREEALEQGSLRWLHALRRDVRIATRTLLRHPTFAITATMALALAIAVNTSMFSVLDAMINPKIGARHPEQLYALRYFGDMQHRLDWGEAERALALGGRTYVAYTGTGYYGRQATIERGSLTFNADATIVRPNFFAVLDVTPIAGTLTSPGDPRSASTAIVISDRLRAQLFRDDESPIGQSIDVDGQPMTVIGVARRYAGSSSLDYDVWLFPSPGRFPGVINLIRLREGVTQAQADAELAVLASRLAAAVGESSKDTRFDLHPIGQQFQVQRFHYALIGAGLAVLLVACTNLANLQIARGLGRASELALRSALGASRRQIVTQLIIESGVLAVAAMVLAVVLALAGNAVIHATIPPNIGNYVVAPQSSWRMVLFAAVAAVLSLVLVGLAPAIRVSRVDLNSLLKSRAGTGAHKTNRRTYGTLVIIQIALTLPLVCAAVLMSRAALRIASHDYLIKEMYGYDPDPLVVASIMWPSGDKDGTAVLDVAGELMSRARAVPNVSDAAVVVRTAGIIDQVVSVDDPDGGVREIPTPGVGFQIVTPSYFRTFGLPIERGKNFTEGAHTEPSIIMDRGSAWYLWPHSAALGRVMKLGNAHSNAPWITIHGVVGDYLSEDARAVRRVIDTLRLNSVFRLMTVNDTFPASKFPTFVTMYVRASQDPQRVASILRRSLHDVAARPPQVTLYREWLGISNRIVTLRFVAALFTTFGVLALGLSALGVYGIVAQSVADRKREVAVRISLGATPMSIVHTLIREGNVLVLAGVAIGLYTTKETIGWLGSFLGEVDLTSALFFGAMCVALFSAMVLSALIPAARATKLDPMEVLRAE